MVFKNPPVCKPPIVWAARPMPAMPFPDSLVGMAPPEENFGAIPGWLPRRAYPPA